MSLQKKTSKPPLLIGKRTPDGRSEGRLAKRDYILLPLIALATAAILLGCGEALARIFWAERLDNTCSYQTRFGERFRPGCRSWEKTAEGPWVVNSYNDCGYRTAESCAVRGPDQLRVVVLGSSAARGAFVAYERTFAALASTAMTSACHRIVDFQNLGGDWRDVDSSDKRMAEVLALQPTAVVMVIGPYDVEHLKDTVQRSEPAGGFHFNFHDLNLQLRKSRLFIVGQHYLYQDPRVQIAGFLRNGDKSSRYLDNPLPDIWRKRVTDVGALLGRITAQTIRANVPVLLFYLPARVQAALAIPKYAQSGVDPFALGKILAAVSRQNGALFVDSTLAFATAREFGSLFYQADGHPTSQGHALIAEEIDSALLAMPAFAQCRTPARAPQ